jgi:hypothetical protein
MNARPTRTTRTFICPDCKHVRVCANVGPTPVRCSDCAKAMMPARRHLNHHAATTAATAITEALAAHGTMTTGALRTTLPDYRPHTLRMSCVALVRKGVLTRVAVYEASIATTRWALRIAAGDGDTLPIMDEDDGDDDDGWTPAPWVHPIRALTRGGRPHAA